LDRPAEAISPAPAETSAAVAAIPAAAEVATSNPKTAPYQGEKFLLFPLLDSAPAVDKV
jgi:hypothetical protein